MLGRVNGHALQVCRAVKAAQQFAHAHRVAGGGDVAAIGAGLRHLVRQAGGSHLPAGHAVDGVVDEDDGDMFAARSRMHGLGHADGGKVAITLIGEHHVVRQHALDARGNRRGAAMRRLDHIAAEEVRSGDGAAHRRDADGAAFDIKLVDDLGDQTVHDAVRATRAVVRDHGQQRLRTREHHAAFALFLLSHAIHRPSPQACGSRPTPHQAWG